MRQRRAVHRSDGLPLSLLSKKGANKMAGKTEEKTEKTEQTAEAKPKGGKKMLIIGIIAVILIINLAIAGTILLRNHSKQNKDKKSVVKVGAKVSLDEFLVNLAGNGNHYLKATFAIGLKEGVSASTIQDDTPIIRDAIITVLTTKTLADVSTDADREKLKQELVNQINTELGSDDVVTIYFLDFATQ
jgi:flagellar FliL protein